MSRWRKHLIGTWSWKRPFYSLFSIYLILLVIVLFFANALIFPAPICSYDESLKHFITFENEVGDKVAATYIQGAEDEPVLLWSHGNAEDLQSLRPLITYISNHRDCGILAYDYPGYGLSEGEASEKGCYQNIRAAWNYLTEDLKVDPARIIILGQSVGSGPSTWLASQDEIDAAGLVLVAPFQSINRVPFGVNLFPKDRFPNIHRIKDVDMPLLVMHGENDRVIKSSHGRALYEAHSSEGESKAFIHIKGVGHNDIWVKDEAYDSLFYFMNECLK